MPLRMLLAVTVALMCVAGDLDAQTIPARRDLPSISEVAGQAVALRQDFLRRGIDVTETSSELGVAREREAVSVTVSADYGGYIYAVCDNACSGLSMTVSVDGEEKTSSGGIPYIEYHAGGSKYFDVEIRLSSCSESACRFRVGVLRR